MHQMPGNAGAVELGSGENLRLTVTQHPAIDPIADEWDRFVPRDVPHLRAGFLRAIERGEMLEAPCYLLAWQEDRLLAVAFAYSVQLDTTMSASPRARKWIRRVRTVFPRFLWRRMRICGPPVSNGECGFYFDAQLPPAGRRQVLRAIMSEVIASAGRKQMVFVKEFTDEAKEEYASELDALGFFSVDPGPATSMALKWDSFDDYLSALKKRYRRRIRTDLKAGSELEIQLVDSFAELAPTASALYNQVVARATYNLEKATEGFFAAVSDFDQASLVVARDRETSEVAGVNLLLFGDTCMHNLYIGFDGEQNERCNTYFNLVENSLRFAIERKFQICYFGPASYEFKTRLGATTFPLTAYMLHPVRFVHRMLQSSRDKLWPKEEIPSHDVFQDERSGDG